jgi:Cu+-exporting ATPase
MAEPGGPRRAVVLEVSGMTCASCASRIEKKLNRVPGVEATVNYATAKATVVAAPDVGVDRLVAVVEAAGYGAQLPAPEAGDADGRSPEEADLRRRLTVSTALAVPVALLSMVPALQFDYWQWVALAFATPVVLWGAWPFHRAAWVNLRHGATTMDTLVSLGITAAYAWSVYALLWGGAGDPSMRMSFHLMPGSGGSDGADLYFEVAAVVTVFLLAGRYAEARAKRASGAAVRALLTLGAKDVAVLRDGVEARVPVEALVVGDLFLARPGDTIATDGVVLEGSSAVDESLLTGESMPVEVGPGSTVTGATVNAGGRLLVRATRVGADTRLAQIARLVEQAQSGKAPIQRLADRVSAVFVPVVLVIALLTLVGWLLATGDTEQAFTAAVSVLVIACPCALGLATPTALLVGTGRGAQLGIVIRGPEVLEDTRRIDTIVLDKTGTVTTGRMAVTETLAAAGQDPGEVLALAAAVEHASAHPVAQAIAAAAPGPLSAVEGFASTTGLGVTGVVDGHAVAVGRPEWLADAWAAALPADLEAQAAARRAEGATVVAVAWDGSARGLVCVADTVKPTSADAVVALRGLGLEPVLLTGDHQGAARAIASEVGIAHVIAEVLPEDKVRVVADLQAEGRVVAMVGDGVNDAAALAAADLGLAMGTGSDAAIEASDLTLVRGDLRSAADAIRLSRRTLGTIKGNLFWAFAYNVAAIPLAVAGLLNPMIAGAAMAFSSVFVVTNSLRLRRFQPLAGEAPRP